MPKIKIVITEKEAEQYEEVVNFLKSETPTEFIEEDSSSYGGNRKKVQFQKEYETRPVQKEKEVERVLLIQELEAEQFDISQVIRAINKLT